jgi:hypothetical protein
MKVGDCIEHNDLKEAGYVYELVEMLVDTDEVRVRRLLPTEKNIIDPQSLSMIIGCYHVVPRPHTCVMVPYDTGFPNSKRFRYCRECNKEEPL